jgi:hypothetical protein
MGVWGGGVIDASPALSEAALIPAAGVAAAASLAALLVGTASFLAESALSRGLSPVQWAIDGAVAVVAISAGLVFLPLLDAAIESSLVGVVWGASLPPPSLSALASVAMGVATDAALAALVVGAFALCGGLVSSVFCREPRPRLRRSLLDQAAALNAELEDVEVELSLVDPNKPGDFLRLQRTAVKAQRVFDDVARLRSAASAAHAADEPDDAACSASALRHPRAPRTPRRVGVLQADALAACAELVEYQTLIAAYFADVLRLAAESVALAKAADAKREAEFLVSCVGACIEQVRRLAAGAGGCGGSSSSGVGFIAALDVTAAAHTRAGGVRVWVRGTAGVASVDVDPADEPLVR